VAAGTVQFAAVNAGSEVHELVIVRFDGEPEDLPVDDDGAMDESALPEEDLIGEIEGFEGGGTTCAGAFDLEPGSYVLLCNIVEEEDGEVEAHFALGMYTTLTVT
jgi:hypothetical protein